MITRLAIITTWLAFYLYSLKLETALLSSDASSLVLLPLCLTCRCFKREADLFRQLGCFQPGVEKHGLPQCLEAGFVTIGSRKVHGYMTMQLLGKLDPYSRQDAGRGRVVKEAYAQPGNFCLNLDSNKKPITFCIDLGEFLVTCPASAADYQPQKQSTPGRLSKPAPTKENAHMHQQFQGTPDYASTRGLLNRFQGACDDLESLAFCLLELWNGR
eukprot:scaffold267433_cov19-Tisochrysis_lutea.AAC.1